MVVMEIHSRYGVLVCKPLTLQAIGDSISEAEHKATKQDLEVAVGSEAVDDFVDSDEVN